MQYALEKIRKADGNELEELLKAVLHRYRQIYPDWDVSVISLEKTGDINQQLDNMILFLESRKKEIRG